MFRYLKLLSKPITFISFFFRACSLKLIINKFDKKNPFEGPLGDNGICYLELSADQLKFLKNKFKINNVDQIIKLDKDYKSFLEYFFGKIKPIINEYFGNNVYIDGINWMFNEPNKKSISSSWHTDNVGNRVKCYVCIEGDGSQPTLVIPSKDRIPNFFSWLKHTFIESFRWLGIKINFDIKNSIKCNHKDGSIYLFDTQLFHRGSYETGNSRRIIFHLEFSNNDKHRFINGPIGTKKNNSFLFDKSLLNLSSFSSMIDPKRVFEEGHNYYRYSEK